MDAADIILLDRSFEGLLQVFLRAALAQLSR
jgi:hypothetical protein